jgi:hypothetical protein
MCVESARWLISASLYAQIYQVQRLMCHYNCWNNTALYAWYIVWHSKVKLQILDTVVCQIKYENQNLSRFVEFCETKSLTSLNNEEMRCPALL